jgi:mediator of RNA polymerase II transcription subunit 28
MENFFLQKRCYLSKTKPELLLKEENADLRHEIARKDEQIKKHIQKLNKWKDQLSDSSVRQPMPEGPIVPGPPMQPGPPQRFPMPPQQQMPPNNPNMFVPNPNMPRPNFSQMQTPPMPNVGGGNHLAFLENITKTTSNIDLPPR